MKPRKHAAIIKQWADGAAIQYRTQSPGTGWKDCDDPAFVDGYEYRVKPARDFEKRYIIVELKVPEDLWREIVRVRS